MVKSLSKEDIEDTLSYTLLPPPKVIYYFTNRKMEYDLGDNETVGLRGIQKAGEDAIYINAGTPKSTIIHETIHNVGVRNETLTRLLTKAVVFRATYGIIPKLRKRNIHYDQYKVPDEERDMIMKEMGLEPTGPQYDDIHLSKLVLRE